MLYNSKSCSMQPLTSPIHTSLLELWLVLAPVVLSPLAAHNTLSPVLRSNLNHVIVGAHDQSLSWQLVAIAFPSPSLVYPPVSAQWPDIASLSNYCTYSCSNAICASERSGSGGGPHGKFYVGI